MFRDICLKKVNGVISFSGKSAVFKEDNTIPELQAKGVTALCKILHNRQYAYLADEVGMGKTYQAIGVIAMLLAEKKNARVLIISPNEAVQNNWKTEIDNFFVNNCQMDTLIDTDEEVQITHPRKIIEDYAKENKAAKIAIVRLTAFSMIAENVARRGANGYSREGDKIAVGKLYSGLTAITNQTYAVKKGEAYEYCDAGKICGSVFRRFSPEYDLVIVDEAQNIRRQNNATAFFNYWMGLKRFTNTMATPAGINLDAREKEVSKRKNCKYLLLSATPAHRGVESLRSQLMYFENEKRIPEISHEYLEQFMIRRLRTYSGSSKYAVRNVCADDVSKGMGIEQRLFLALIQSRLAQIPANNNTTFKIGFLETFESYDASGEDEIRDEETGETGKEFENGGSSKEDEKGSAADKGMLKDLAKSYGRAFNGEKCPPHPKLSYMQQEAAPLIKTNLNPGITGGTDKALIFVRRLASVDELVNRRLNKMYEDELIAYWGKRFEIKNANLTDIQRAFQNCYKNTVPDEADEEITEEINIEDTNEVRSRMISWMSVNKSDKGVPFSSVSLFKKSLMRNKPNAYLFDENYYRTAHADEKEKAFKRRVDLLVTADFVKEVCNHIQADPSRYIQQQTGKRKLNHSYLLALCCYLALSKEKHPIAGKIKEYYMINDGTESDGKVITSTQIIRILKQTSLWNWLGKCDRDSGKILDLWFSEESFNKREAIKSWTAKYLKTSEAVLELLYVYSTQKDWKDKSEFCKAGWNALYAKTCSHGLRIRQLFTEDNANLVCNQVSGISEIDYRYDPKFMNNQQWVMPATGGNKGNEALIKRFNTPFYPDIIVCTDVLKEGINLHLFCNKVYHYGLAWTPGDLEQRVGRVDRFFSKTHRAIMEHKEAHVDVTYPYMGKTVDEQQLRKVLEFKLSADPLLDSTGAGMKDILFNLTDVGTVEELAKYIPSQNEQTNFPYSGEKFWKEE